MRILFIRVDSRKIRVIRELRAEIEIIVNFKKKLYMKKLRVGILGATGMVGQRFVTLLTNHPWFEITVLAASPNSAGKSYKDAVSGRWKLDQQLPQSVRNIKLYSVKEDTDKIIGKVDLIFSALDMEKDEIKKLEISYANRDVAVVSNNSAYRFSDDVPMIIPEVNPQHIKLIDYQRANRVWKKGLICVKPNCSIQSYVTVLTALKQFKPLKVLVTSLQAISGAGKTFDIWPEMTDNVIPFIKNEEEKSEKEPMKIWGVVKNGRIENARMPKISASCIRIPVNNGHMANVAVNFRKNPSKEQIISAIKNYPNPLRTLKLPSAPKELIRYFDEQDRPQTKLDRDFENGMGITMGRLREDNIFNWKFIALSHNTIRGAAGGAILLAELLKAKGYL